MQTLISIEQREQMIQNGLQTQKDHIGNHWPVVKLFTPDANCTWLLSELDPEEPDIAFGLCDLGLGFPEIGSVSFNGFFCHNRTILHTQYTKDRLKRFL